MITSDPDLLKEIIERFRERASNLRKRAKYIIFIIVGVLVGGILVFLTAGELANIESNKAVLAEKRSRATQINDTIDEVKNEINLNQSEMNSLNAKIERGLSNNSNISSPNRMLIEQYQRQFAQMQEKDIKLRERLSHLQEIRFSIAGDIAQTEASAGQVAADISKDKNQISIIISATAMRITSVVLLIFLIRILVPLYRYNIKLASYYDARADALKLFDSSNYSGDDVLERITKIISPEAIDFGAAPLSPTEQAFELTKRLLDVQRNK